MSAEIGRADRLCRVFCNVIEDLITAQALRESVGDGLSRAQFTGLQYVHLHPKCCIKDLARGLAISHPAAVKLVERLEAKGLLARSAHERDRRAVHLATTDLGAEQAHAAMAARARAIQKVLRKAGRQCTRDLFGCLEAFIRAALTDEKDVDGVCLHCGGHHDDDCPVCQAELELTGQLRDDS